MNNTLTRIATALLLVSTLPLIQACVPLVAVTGIGAGALIISDRRSSGAYIEDESIGWKVEERIVQKFGSDTHVNAVSYNRSVLLSGEVPDAATKAEIGRLAGEVVNVKSVVNEVVVGSPSSTKSRVSDTYLTSKIKARFVEANKFSANHVRVHASAGTAFLLGIVTRQEADDASQIAATTSGVEKVVRVFEYIDDSQAKQLDARPAEDTRKK
ncbi:MAG: BON domain-containing protein [Sterolibacteriaceae bacterium]|uniref:BON domain-containing protein n=1 Tax=Candidatus Methylophosphatis roskildensis TaxID=2899263 RepID=A0A9D7HTA6_9PROT|nr:BON domain-containing protein [Candidatus Methylophosphatis roskildensis]MBK7235562.1 BON domain-containing protein [Sterolibacteriaceae bacterium]